MGSDFVVLVTWVRTSDMELRKTAVKMSRDTLLGQNYQYWNEEDVAKQYAELFDFDEEVKILAVEEIEGVR